MTNECTALFKQQQDMAQCIIKLQDHRLPLSKQYVVLTYSFQPYPQTAAVPGTGVWKYQLLTKKKSLENFNKKRGMWQNGFIQ